MIEKTVMHGKTALRMLNVRCVESMDRHVSWIKVNLGFFITWNVRKTLVEGRNKNTEFSYKNKRKTHD